MYYRLIISYHLVAIFMIIRLCRNLQFYNAVVPSSLVLNANLMWCNDLPVLFIPFCYKYTKKVPDTCQFISKNWYFHRNLLDYRCFNVSQ